MFTQEPISSRLVSRRSNGGKLLLLLVSKQLHSLVVPPLTLANRCTSNQVLKVWKPREDCPGAKVRRPGGEAPDRRRHCALQSAAVPAQAEHHGAHSTF